MDCNYHTCTKKLRNKAQLVEHFFVHSKDAHFKMLCPFCPTKFNDYNVFKQHAKALHLDNLILRTKNDLPEIYVCNDDLCSSLKFNNQSDLINHLETHLNVNKNEIECLYCENSYANKNSYRKHASHYHRGVGFKQVKNSFKFIPIENNNNNDDIEMNDLELDNIQPIDLEHNNLATVENNQTNVSVNETSNSDTNIEELCDLYNKTYLKYNSLHMIPNYVCSEIFEDIGNFISLNNSIIINTIRLLVGNNVEFKKIANKIIDHINIANTYELVHKKNKNESNRLTWKQKTNRYVEPVQINLDDQDKFHYVPILSNIKALLNNEQIKYEYFKTKNSSDKIRSIETANFFKNNKFFLNNKDAIQIKLYIDAFTTTNVLGPNKNNYKQHGVYYKINNIPFNLQSKNYVTQLALLFDNNYLIKYGYDRILHCLVQDLKTLETQGIIIGDRNLLGSIIYLCADNLGANSICGFVESFGCRTSGLI